MAQKSPPAPPAPAEPGTPVVSIADPSSMGSVGLTPDGQKRRTRVARAKPYPPTSLESVLQIANAIRESRGREMGLVALATALDRSPGSSGFRVLITGSADYGMTRGNYKSDSIGLTDRGMAYARPRDDSERSDALLQAALTPPLFAQLYNEIAPGKWPPDGNVENILVRNFQVPAEFAPQAGAIAKANARYVGLLQEAKGGLWLILNPELRRIAAAGFGPQSTETEPAEALDAGTVDDAKSISEVEDTEPRPGAQDRRRSGATDFVDPGSADRVFVSHSKNQTLLDQIKTILEFGRFEAIVAEEEETTAIPVPEKVLMSMRRCGSAVISVSFDEAERREDGSYGINQNVLIEIGAAFALYDRRVVLVVDTRVQLPSNLQGLYRSEYEGAELGWTAGMKLQKALTNFREH